MLAGYGARSTPASVMKPVMSDAGSDIEGGIPDRHADGCRHRAPEASHLGGRPLLDVDVRAIGRRAIERRQRPSDVERQSVLARQDRQTVGADLVGGVTVRCHPIAAHHDGLDHARGHGRRRRVVHDEPERDACRIQLPGRQSAALEQWPRFADDDLSQIPGRVLGIDDAKGRAVAARGQPTRVAVGHDPAQTRQLGPAVLAQRETRCRVLRMDGGRLVERGHDDVPAVAVRRPCRRPYPGHGSGEVDGRGSRGADHLLQAQQLVAGAVARKGARRDEPGDHAVGARDADRGRAAHSENLDRRDERSDRR